MQENAGVWIPSYILFDNDLNGNFKILLSIIDGLGRVDGCFAKNEYIAKYFNDVSESRISQMISTLKDKGKITVEYEHVTRSFTKRIIKICSQSYVGKNTEKKQWISVIERMKSEKMIQDTIKKYRIPNQASRDFWIEKIANKLDSESEEWSHVSIHRLRARVNSYLLTVSNNGNLDIKQGDAAKKGSLHDLIEKYG